MSGTKRNHKWLVSVHKNKNGREQILNRIYELNKSLESEKNPMVKSSLSTQLHQCQNFIKHLEGSPLYQAF